MLSKSKTNNKTQFIDVSGEEFFKKVTNNNEMTDTHIEEVMKMFDSKEEVAHVATSVDKSKIAENDYNLSVSSYVEPKDTREKINIEELNQKISKTVEKINELRADIDAIINEIES